jgi:hypothetical protein
MRHELVTLLSKNPVRKNRLKRDGLVFLIHPSDSLAEHANLKMHPGNGPTDHDVQIPAYREFETHHECPLVREFDLQNSDFPQFVLIGVHSWFKKVILEKRSQTLPVIIEFL